MEAEPYPTRQRLSTRRALQHGKIVLSPVLQTFALSVLQADANAEIGPPGVGGASVDDFRASYCPNRNFSGSITRTVT